MFLLLHICKKKKVNLPHELSYKLFSMMSECVFITFNGADKYIIEYCSKS